MKEKGVGVKTIQRRQRKGHGIYALIDEED